MRGFGIAFQRCQRLQPPFRVRIRKLELHQHAGNHAANATVGLEVVEIGLVGKPGLSAAVDINQRHLAVAGILDKEEPAIAFALPHLLLPPFLEKHRDCGQLAVDQLLEHRSDGGAGRLFDIGPVCLEQRVEIGVLRSRGRKRSQSGKKEEDDAKHGTTRTSWEGGRGREAPFPW
jgi:hypothetical protein